MRGHLPGRTGLEQHAMPESWMSRFPNSVTVGGSLANTPKLRQTKATGAQYCLLIVRVRYRRAALVRVRVWGAQALSCSEWLLRGDEVIIHGRFGAWRSVVGEDYRLGPIENVVDAETMAIVWSTRERMLRDQILLHGEEPGAVDLRRKAGVEPVDYGDAVIPAETLAKTRAELALFAEAFPKVSEGRARKRKRPPSGGGPLDGQAGKQEEVPTGSSERSDSVSQQPSGKEDEGP